MRKLLYVITFMLWILAILFWLLTIFAWFFTDTQFQLFSLPFESTLFNFEQLNKFFSSLGLSFEPLNVFASAIVATLGGGLTLLGARRASRDPILESILHRQTPSQRKRNRKSMLKLSNDYWIKGVLKASLGDAHLIALQIRQCPEQVTDSINPEDFSRHNAYDLKGKTNIFNVFKEANHSLLILGEVGSGKTTTLLELAHKAILLSNKDTSLPIPVIFKLSSWTKKNKTIDEWLTNELKIQYGIPNHIAHQWLKHDDLLLLLDGLDEIGEEENRETCVRAINDYLNEHLVFIAVCCRTTVYERLSTKLKFRGAIRLQPLTTKQINSYLEKRSNLQYIKRILHQNKELEELVKTPLILSLMTHIDSTIFVENLITSRKEDIVTYMVDLHIATLLKHRRNDQLATDIEIEKRLSWLAKRMDERNLSIFQVKQLDPTWVFTSDLEAFTFLTAISVIYGFLVGFASYLVLGFIFNPNIATSFGISFGLGVFFASWLSSIFFDIGYALAIALTNSFPNPAIVIYSRKTWLGTGLIIGLFAGVGTVLINTSITVFQWELLIIAVCGLVIGISSGIIVGRKWSSSETAYWWDWVGGRFISYLITRIMLYFFRDVPRNYTSFLDYASESSLLQKVGKGYTFKHELFSEHFRTLDQD